MNAEQIIGEWQIKNGVELSLEAFQGLREIVQNLLDDYDNLSASHDDLLEQLDVL